MIRGIFDLVIYQRDIKIELTSVLGHKLTYLELNNDIALELGMVEQHIQKIIISLEYQVILITYICKTYAKLKNKLFEMLNQSLF